MFLFVISQYSITLHSVLEAWQLKFLLYIRNIYVALSSIISSLAVIWIQSYWRWFWMLSNFRRIWSITILLIPDTYFQKKIRVHGVYFIIACKSFKYPSASVNENKLKLSNKHAGEYFATFALNVLTFPFRKYLCTYCLYIVQKTDVVLKKRYF